MLAHLLDVDARADAVPTARRFVASTLAPLVDPEVVEAAELVVTELLTNALLHGQAPVRVAVSGRPGQGVARVEVHDGSKVLPVRTISDSDGMTGRGLALVDAVCADWGVEPTGDGKSVWAELSASSVEVAEPGDVDLDLLLAGVADDDEDVGPRRYTITLGDVPTDLLLAAKAHVDSIVRELLLTSGGARSGLTSTVPAALAALLHDVVDEFAEARQAIKRQALAAASRGERRTRLTLTLPAEAADAGLRYLAALEEADAYGRSARLLTLEAPPQHQAFRRWYITSLVAGLRSASAQGTAVVAPSFETFLLAEVDTLAELQRVSARGARLQRVTAALAGALDRAGVRDILVAEARGGLGADAVELALQPHGPEEQGGGGLVGQAWRTGEPVWVENPEQRARIPGLVGGEAAMGACCAVPLQAGGHVVGVLLLTFRDERLFTEDERAFLCATASVAAQALERAELVATQARTAERLAQLQAVTSALADTQSVEEVLDVVLEHGTGLVGVNVASISLLAADGHTLELVRVRPAHMAAARWATFDLQDDVPAAEAVRTGSCLWVTSVEERDARWPAIAVTRRDEDSAFAAMPLLSEGVPLGALTLSFPVEEGGPALSPEFLMAFANVCAQALRRARAAESARTALRRLAFLADASEALAGTLEIEKTLANVAGLCVPELADFCLVHLLEDGELTCVAVEHEDPAQVALAVGAQRRWPETLADSGVGAVVRSGTPLLVPSLEEARAQRAAAGLPVDQIDPEHAALLEQFGLRSALLVPLTARGRTFGALTLLFARSGRRYGPADLPLLEDLARRAAVAVDNARVHAVAQVGGGESSAAPPGNAQP